MLEILVSFAQKLRLSGLFLAIVGFLCLPIALTVAIFAFGCGLVPPMIAFFLLDPNPLLGTLWIVVIGGFIYAAHFLKHTYSGWMRIALLCGLVTAWICFAWCSVFVWRVIGHSVYLSISPQVASGSTS